MLKQRILTAIVLLAIILSALLVSSPLPFCAVAVAAIAAAGWEWGRLNGYKDTGSLLMAIVLLVACVIGWQAGLMARPSPVLWCVVGGIWVLLGAWLLRRGVGGWAQVPRAVRLIGGLALLWLAWLAIAQARFVGTNFLLSVMVLVWVADIGAYFAGRAFGLKFTRSKLAPSISPGKSWEGVWGGMVGVLVLAVAWVWADATYGLSPVSLYSLLAARGWWLLVPAVVFLAAMSVVGDLVESLVKRSAGAKDSSQLLPGHGGVLDRIDALLPAVPLAMMLATAVGV
ncbi:phosphatidate cytidylyltransferase [Xylophilus sp. GOD-11R]|uniref:phosphatidate cytidylyltransferase n=1 Tax=Xylophilus sp. GOD-11R TaxID=3089814 RepID=UPI00298C2416|nr:phosphatidate cytidylyltransferase [Xylophilus sp. GOD-11R]WPB58680.1 phosphatidate cytidylyltransferase [Xylophilus sp. GOD-11R]